MYSGLQVHVYTGGKTRLQVSFDLYATQRRAGEQLECVVAFAVSADASRVALVRVARNTYSGFLEFVLLAYVVDLYAIQTSRKTARECCSCCCLCLMLQ